MNWAISSGLDIAIVLIFAFCIFFGVRRGLVKSIIGLVGNIVALILAIVFSAGLGEYLDTNYVNASMRGWLVNQLTSSSEEAAPSDVDLDDLFANTPDFFVNVCEFLGVDMEQLQSDYENWKTEGEDQAKSAVITAMVNPISSIASRVIAFALIFIIASLGIFLLSLLIHLIVQLPVIRHLDKTGGGVLGALSGLLLVFVLVSVFSAGTKYFLRGKTDEEREQITQGTILYKVFEDINPLQNILNK